MLHLTIAFWSDDLLTVSVGVKRCISHLASLECVCACEVLHLLTIFVVQKHFLYSFISLGFDNGDLLCRLVEYPLDQDYVEIVVALTAAESAAVDLSQ